MRYSLLIIVLLYSKVGITQTVETKISVEMGSIFKMDKRSVPNDIIGFDSTGYYILYADGKYGNGNKTIIKFNNDFTPSEKRLRLLTEEESNNTYTLGIIKIDSNIFHVSASTIKNLVQYNVQKINIENLSIDSKETIAHVKIGDANLKYYYRTFMISEDTSKIALLYTIPDKNMVAQKIRVIIFNKKFKKISSDDYEFPFYNVQFHINDLVLRNNGEIILLARNYFRKDLLNTDNKKEYEYILYKLHKGKSTKLSKIQVEERHLEQIILFETKSKDLIVTGFYSEKSIYAIKGSFYQRFDSETGEIKAKHVQDFSDDFFISLATNTKRVAKNVEKGTFEDAFYILFNIFEESNGDILLVAEQVHTFTNQGITTYYYENIALVKLNLSGELIQNSKIGKNNTKMNVNIYSHYYAYKHDSSIYFLYNGNKRNINHFSGHVANAFAPEGGGVFINTMVSEDGNYVRSILLDEQKLNGIRIRPRLTRRLNENTLLLFGQNPGNVKHQCFIKLVFD